MTKNYTQTDVEGHIRNMDRALGRFAIKPTRKAAIRAFCVSCVGGVLDDVKTCPSTDCPLYRYRLGEESKEP